MVHIKINKQINKRLLLIKENQTSQVKEFSAFLCVGRCKSLGSLKSFLWHEPQLSGASILCFLFLFLFLFLTNGLLELVGVFFNFYFILAHRWLTTLCYFRCTAKWFSYTRIYSFSNSLWFLILSLLRVHCRVGWGDGGSGWLLDGGHPVHILSSLRAHLRGGCNVMAWWLQHPLFTDTAGDIFFSFAVTSPISGFFFFF